MQQRVAAIFNGVDFSDAKGELVGSAPRPRPRSSTTKNSSTKQLQGIPRLAEAVNCLHAKTPPRVVSRVVSSTAASKKRCDLKLYCMQGSMGDLKADFLYEIQNAMTGRTGAAAGSISKKVTKKVTKNDWAAVVEHSTRLCVLWPSRHCAGSKMSVSSFLNLRSMPAKHWKEKISEKAKDFCFFDASPNPAPHYVVEQKRLPAGHAKVLLLEENGRSTCYVGSHNLSKAAWGVGGSQPQNVELGVVLCSTNPQEQKLWRERLPCELPTEEQLQMTATAQ